MKGRKTRCQVDLGRDALRGTLMGLGLLALVSGWGFALVGLWLGFSVTAAGALVFLIGRRIPARWCFDGERLVLGGRSVRLSEVEALEVQPVSRHFCQSWRVRIRLRSGRAIPFPLSVEDPRALWEVLAGAGAPIRGDADAFWSRYLYRRERGVPLWISNFETILWLLIAFDFGDRLERAMGLWSYPVVLLVFLGFRALEAYLECARSRKEAKAPPGGVFGGRDADAG